jgi:hypothetical protein
MWRPTEGVRSCQDLTKPDPKDKDQGQDDAKGIASAPRTTETKPARMTRSLGVTRRKSEDADDVDAGPAANKATVAHATDSA